MVRAPRCCFEVRWEGRIVVTPPGRRTRSPGGVLWLLWWGLDVAGCVLVVFWRAHATSTTHLVSRSLYNAGAHGGCQRLQYLGGVVIA